VKLHLSYIKAKETDVKKERTKHAVISSIRKSGEDKETKQKKIFKNMG
jgi:hypothetical protein